MPCGTTGTGFSRGALSGATIALEVLSGAAIAFFTTVFFLLDGERIWGWCVSLFPRRGQPDIRAAGLRSWAVLTAYVRGTILIAFTDGVFVGLSVAVIGVPLAVPLGVLVFFGAFVPIVGALVSGFVAVVVALAAKGVFAALAVLVAIIVVQQIEGHLLQPLVMGRLVSLHPLGVVLAVTAGSVLAGLVGAVVAVPVAAVLTTVLGYYGRRAREAPRAALAGNRRRRIWRRTSNPTVCRPCSRTSWVVVRPGAHDVAYGQDARDLALLEDDQVPEASAQHGLCGLRERPGRGRVDDLGGQVGGDRLLVHVGALGDGAQDVALGQDPGALAVGIDDDCRADVPRPHQPARLARGGPAPP